MSDMHAAIGRKRQGAIYTAGVEGKVPAVPVAQAELIKAARRPTSERARF